MIKIDRSAHPSDADKVVRVTTDQGVVIVPMTEWAFALAHVGSCGPEGQPSDTPHGGTPVANRMAA
jgi:hypothetical protein